MMPQQSACRNRLLRAMSPADFGSLSLQVVRLPLRTMLIEPGVPVEHLYFMEEGLASITTDSSAGQVEVGMVGREGLVGATPVLLDSHRTPYAHFVQMAGEACRVPTPDLLAAVGRSASLRSLLLRYVQAHMIQVTETAFANAVHTIEARLARWLLMCRDRADGDEIAVTHEFLAMMLGVRRPGVTVATQLLEGNHLIKATRGRITVLDRQGLEDLADDGYGLAEAEYAALIGDTEREPPLRPRSAT